MYGFYCSHCTTNTPIGNIGILNEQHQLALKKWVDERTLNRNDELENKVFNLLKKTRSRNLMAVLTLLKTKGQYLKSSDALELIENSSEIARCHIITAHVLDYWNIKTKRVGGNWPSYLVCYYGNYDSPSLPKIASICPRNVLYCTETAPILNSMQAAY